MDFEISCELDDKSLQLLYAWVDGIPLSRKKKNITRDFSDGGWCFQLAKIFKLFLKNFLIVTKIHGNIEIIT